MQTSPFIQQHSPIASHVTLRGSLSGGNPDMTPLVEVPMDPTWPDRVRTAIASQPDAYFQRHFDGRLPSANERREHIERAVFLMTPLRIFQNNLYRVEVQNTPPITPTFVHLAITRLDGGTCNEWADLQRIKNQIVGPEHEAVELFPSESRLVNTGNQYHLWVHSDPNYRFPLGWIKRMVFSEPIVIKHGPTRPPGVLDNTAAQPRVPVGRLVLFPAGRQ